MGSEAPAWWHPQAHVVPQILSLRPMRWLGTRSYAIYLWHWPIITVTRPGLDTPLDGLALFALRLAITLLAAELSYRLVEAPVRNGALDRSWRALRLANGWQRVYQQSGWPALACSWLPSPSPSLGPKRPKPLTTSRSDQCILPSHRPILRTASQLEKPCHPAAR